MDATLQKYIDKLNALNFKEMYEGDFFLTWDKSDDELEAVFTVADALRYMRENNISTKIFESGLGISLFRDNSTRTRFSFASACNLLGLEVQDLDEGKSQIAHGETVRETANMISFMADVIGIRDDMYIGKGHTYQKEVAEAVTQGHKDGVLEQKPTLVNLQCDIDHPTQANLVGRVERIQQYGALVTDFTLIKAGALHRANGGFLLMDARKLLLQPYSWDSLKRALASKTVKIETPSDETCFTTISLDPCPIPLDIKVILTGDEELYEMLTERDPDFCDYFKVEADFGVLMDRTFENEVEYAKLIGSLSKKKKIRSLNKQAVAKVIEYSSRLAEDSEKLTAHIASIGDLLREADFWARKSKANQIGKNHIEQAISEQIYRSDRIKQAMLEQIDKGTILIDVEGAKVGQINGLVVYNFSRNSFGKPSRITTQVRMGKGEFIDIEREIQMSGPIHTKGVLILSSLIANRFAKESPLSLSASIVFEQSYGGVDGDSASSTEYYCLLSAISNIPIKQNIAVTGSINQFGEIQPIGGANEKIEGFFDVCKHRGLTGDQGVIIPRTNVSSLMLREDVLQAVEEGQFHIWAVDTVDDGIEILTGMPAGKPNKNGEYPKGTVNYAVQKGLEHYYKCYVRYARETHGCLGK